MVLNDDQWAIWVFLPVGRRKAIANYIETLTSYKRFQ